MPRPASNDTTPLRQIRALYQSALQLGHDDRWVADYIYCIALSSRIGRQHEMAWGFLDAPPATGKTEATRPLERVPWIFKLDGVTSKSFVSGKEIDEGEEDPSLLPKLYNKVILFADFTTMMDNHQEESKAIMSILRRSFDRDNVVKAFGTVGVRAYPASFGVLACSTGGVDQFLARDATLGERFLKLRMFRSRIEYGQACLMMDHIEGVSPEKLVWRDHMAAKIASYLRPYDEPLMGIPIPTMTDGIRDRFRKLVFLTAAARMPPVGEYVRPTEGPARLQQQFTTLVAVRARLDRRSVWTEEDFQFISRVAYDTIPIESATLLYLLYNAADGLTMSRLEDALYTSRKVLPNLLMQFRSAGLIVRSTKGPEKYTLAAQTRSHYEAAGFPESALPASNYLLTGVNL